MNKVSFINTLVISIFLVQSFPSRAFADETTQEGIAINGSAPSLAVDDSKVFMTYASGDTISFCFSTDNGKIFSTPALVAILPQLSLGGGRGPQITSVKDKLMIAAADKAGNIYTYIKNKNTPEWTKGARINDVPDIAKEAFVSLASGNKQEVYAVWLDLRNNNKNKIVGAKSMDGGKTWSRNKIIYISPTGTVCECCKPSVAMKGQMVVVMFRNSLNGNRDLYIIKSLNGGLNFGKAQQLGEGNWKLNACPMDGGGLVINNDNTINTVWRREMDIYNCEVGSKEKMIAVGKQCKIAGMKDDRFIAFVNDGKVYCMKPNGDRIELGAGAYPELKITSATTALCAWQYKDRIFYDVISN